MSQASTSLVRRLVASAVIWALPMLLIALLALSFLYRTSTYRFFEEPLENTVTSLIAAADIDQRGRLVLTQEPVDPVYQRGLSGRYWLLAGLGENGEYEVLRRSRSLAGSDILLNPAHIEFMRSFPAEFLKVNAEGPNENEIVRVAARKIVLPNRIEPIIMVAAADSAPARRDVNRFLGLSLAMLALVAGALFFAIYRQVRVGLRPLFDLRDEVVGVREGRAGSVEGQYPTEIQPLASELNSLIEHNKTVVEQAKTHVSNLAHALKTPLAVMINEAAGTDTVPAELVTRQTDAMKRQVDHHLQRARAAARGQAIGVSTSIAETIEPIARTLPRIYRDKDIDLQTHIQEGLLFRGEKRDLEEMVGNLMDNACKWCKGQVSVTAILNHDDETQILISVSDDGPGIKPEDYALALKRGERLDEATPGTGFGLPIVNDLAKAYKGNLSLSRADIGGLCVTLDLPGRLDG